jgi:hypothetical protein
MPGRETNVRSELVDPTKPEVHSSTNSIPDTPFVKEVSELTSNVNQSEAMKRLFLGRRVLPPLSSLFNTKGKFHAVGS